MRDCRRRRLAATLIASIVLPSPLVAQSGLTHLDDARLVPRGMLRLHAASAWSRYDSRFGDGGAVALGGRFTADSLGVAQLPELSGVESTVETATGAPFTLSLGRSRVDAIAREEVVPLALEYGVTDRFTVGVTMPLVRKRIAVQFRLDTAGGFEANVGPNQHRTNLAAAQNNAVVQAQFGDAALQLQQRLATCQANPAGAGCAALLAREAEAQQLLQSSQAFASALGSLYGTATTPGMAFVPSAASAAQAAIAARVAAFNAQYRDLLSAGADLLIAVPSAAGGPAGPADLQRFLTQDLARDSLTIQERVGVGDVEIGFKLGIVNRVPTEAGGPGLLFTVGGAVRLPTGSRQSASELMDMRLGGGSVVLDSRAILDAQSGRFGLVAAGMFATSLRTVDTLGAAPVNTRWTEVHLAPRYHLSTPFAIHGAYSLRTTDGLGTDQIVGGGVSFSMFSLARTSRAPVEMRFTHLESISGDAGRPKFVRDQLELRIYYRLRR